MKSESLEEGGVRVLFLGTGTSTGIPMIACDCKTCTSADPRDKRLRASIFLRWKEGATERNLLVDTSTDLRQQSLLYGIKRVDGVLFTHSHADHIHGIDELRSFNFIQKELIPCYGSAFTLTRIKTMFDYIFNDSQEGGGKPKLVLHPVSGDFTLFGRNVTVLPAMHGEMEVFGFRVGSFAYLTDCNHVPDSTLGKMLNLKLLVIGAVRTKIHLTHFNVDQAIEMARRVKAFKTYITHVNHHIMHKELSDRLPEKIFLSYDGLEETVRD